VTATAEKETTDGRRALAEVGMTESAAVKAPRTQAEKAAALRALHQREGAFLIPNPYDAGSARLLELLGFEALATTSSGFAATLGQLDHGVTRDQVIEHVRVVAAATNLPLSADLENGFGDAPEDAAETIRLGAAAGLAGGSIEDSTGRRDAPVYELAHAVDRVRAAVEASRSLPFPFMLTARAENLISGRPDLPDTIRRLQAYQEAGADVLFAPGVATNEDITAVVRSVDRPVNVLIGMLGMTQSFEELQALGVKRISVGGALSAAALGGFMRAAREMREQGTFTFLRDAVRFRDLAAAFRK
jgi:2-methylisocitrate lyase-like PEP mutase family enzyme